MKPAIPELVIGPKLRACLDSGGVEGMFRLLPQWSLDDLRQLEREIGEWLESADKTLTAIYTDEAFKSENFFSRAAHKSVDGAVLEKRMEVNGIACEIYSVLYCFLPTDESEVRP